MATGATGAIPPPTGGDSTDTDPGEDDTGNAPDMSDDDESEGSEGGDDPSSGGTGIFDIPMPEGNDCGAEGTPDFGYLWVANSPQGTISKIDTNTMTEDGRYYVRPDTAGSPSRTSVNLSGDVAVGARRGGLTKVYGDLSKCAAGATSAGKDDVKAWPDPCVAWHTPFPYSSQRGVAWIPAEYNQQTCSYEDEKLWTTGTTGQQIEVVLVDGETGVPEDTVVVTSASGGGYGVYGAAVDGAGNFWGWVPSGNKLLYVDRATMQETSYDTPSGGYGIAVDKAGRPWLCSGQVSRFDPVAMTWETAGVGGGGAGCMEDGLGTLWISKNGITGIDTETLAEVANVPIPAFIKGISVQPAGEGKVFIWGVTTGPDAHKVDPDTGTYETYTGLNSPYTYSDMTGFGLYNAGDPSG